MVQEVQSSREDAPPVPQQTKDRSSIFQLPVLGTIRETSISESENVSALILGVGTLRGAIHHS